MRLLPDGSVDPESTASDMSAFYRHVEDTHLDVHPQYRLESVLIGDADINTSRRFTIHAANLAALVALTPSAGTEGWAASEDLWLYYTGSTWKLKGEQVIARTVLTGGPASSLTCTLPTIPNGSRLRVQFRARHASTTSVNVNLQMNGDTGANYVYSVNYDHDTVGTGENSPVIGTTSIVIGSCGNESADRWADGEFAIFDYLGTSNRKGGYGIATDPRAATDYTYFRTAGYWGVNSAVTSLRVFAGSGSFTIGTAVTVYGTSV
jgi:hypothetical protein